MFFETEQLVADKLTLEDAVRFHEICNQKFILRWMDDWEHSLEEVRGLIEFFIRGYDIGQPGQHPFVMAVRLKDKKQLIGICGFGPKEELGGDVEIAYFIDEAYSGRGYMSSVAEKAIDFYFCNYGYPYLSALVEADNVPSYKLLMKNGFELYPMDDEKGKLKSHYRLYRK